LKDYCKILIKDKKQINQSAWHLLIISLNFNKLKTTKNKLIHFFIKKKIYLQVHYIPIYKFKIFKKNKINKYKTLPGAEKYFKSSISLPIFYKMGDRQVQFVINTLFDFIKRTRK